MKKSLLLVILGLLLSLNVSAEFRIDREITLTSEIEIDSWVQRPQFPKEIIYKHSTATYQTSQKNKVVKFTCGPVGHTIRVLEKVEGSTEYKADGYIRIQTSTAGKKKCLKMIAKLHKLNSEDNSAPLAVLKLMDRNKFGRAYVSKIQYKMMIEYLR